MPAAYGSIQSLNEDDRSGMLPAFFARWAELDPVAALERASMIPEEAGLAEVNSAIFYVWTQADPAAAEAWVWAVSESGKRRDAAIALACGLVVNDPDRALRFLRELEGADHGPSLTSISDLGDMYGSVFYIWAEKESATAAQRALSLSAGGKRSAALNSAAQMWAKQDGRGALAWASRLPELSLRNAAVGAVVRSLCEGDPREALARIVELPASPSRDAWLTQAIKDIAPLHPEMAIELASLVPTGSGANRTLVDLATELAKSDGAAAVALLETLPAGGWRNEASNEIAKQWALQDRDAALAWAGQLSGKARGRAVFEILENWSESDPAAAVAWASAHGEKGSLATLGTAWARTDPEAAITWAQALPKDGARAEIISRLVQGVTDSDPARAGQLIATDLRGKAQADAARILHQAWREDDAAAADRWFQAMPSFSQETKIDADDDAR